MALYREEMDKMRCGEPGCTHEDHDGLFLHGKCHIESPSWVEYRDGVILVTCATCNKMIAVIAVAKTPKEFSNAED